MKLVEVETREDLERAVNDQTAMMLFYNNNNPEGRIQDEEFVQLGKKHGIPTLNDAAADVPPVDNLWKYTKMGFDLVAFSGGKGLRGPQSAGLLLGRKDLIAAARLNAPPNGNTIGRGLKVNKEEMVGMLAALERYVAMDHAVELRDFEKRAETIRSSAAAVSGVKAEVFVPEVANHVPHVRDLVGRRRQGDHGGGGRQGAERRRAVDRDPLGRRRPGHRRLDDATRRGQDRRAPSARGSGEKECEMKPAVRTMLDDTPREVNRRSFFKTLSLGAAGAMALTGEAAADAAANFVQAGVKRASEPSALKITDLRTAVVVGAPMTCPLIRIDTNQGLVGWGEVRDGSSETYALFLKSRILGENPATSTRSFERSSSSAATRDRPAGCAASRWR